MPSEAIRTLIVDDERLARRGLRLLLRDEPDVTIHGECESGAAAIAHLQSDPVDLIFLDVRMPELDGFSVLERLAPGDRPLVVFATAYGEHARRAFDVRALDYIVKPFEPARVRDVLDRVRECLALRRLARYDARLEHLLARYEGAHAEPKPTRSDQAIARQRFAVRTADGIRLVSDRAIDWIEAAGYYAKLHIGREVVMVRESLDALERRLDPARFTRIHRSAMVSLDCVELIQPYFHGRGVVILRDGTRLILSRTRRPAVTLALGVRL